MTEKHFETQHLPEANPSSISSIKKYTNYESYRRNYSNELNSALWENKPLDAELQEIDQDLTSSFEQSSEAKVFDSLWFGSDHVFGKTDEEFILKSWQSSSRVYDGAKFFGKNIYLAHNALGLDIQEILPVIVGKSLADREWEIIVKKGQKFLIGKPEKREVMSYDDDSNETNIETVEYIPIYCIKE